jgi:hypothetical protein
LPKAFDCVSHDILLGKLNYYEIRGIINQWTESYVTNRKQKVEITHNKLGKITSDWGIRYGVLQG